LHALTHTDRRLLQVQPDELKAIAGGFDDGGANLRGSGLKLSGEKFMFLRADDEMMAGKKGPGGVTIYKTAQAIIIGTYNENMAAGTNSIQVSKIADYLKESGY